MILNWLEPKSATEVCQLRNGTFVKGNVTLAFLPAGPFNWDLPNLTDLTLIIYASEDDTQDSETMMCDYRGSVLINLGRKMA